MSGFGSFKDVLTRGGIMRTTVIPQKLGMAQQKFKEFYR